MRAHIFRRTRSHSPTLLTTLRPSPQKTSHFTWTCMGTHLLRYSFHCGTQYTIHTVPPCAPNESTCTSILTCIACASCQSYHIRSGAAFVLLCLHGIMRLRSLPDCAVPCVHRLAPVTCINAHCCTACTAACTAAAPLLPHPSVPGATRGIRVAGRCEESFLSQTLSDLERARHASCKLQCWQNARSAYSVWVAEPAEVVAGMSAQLK